MKKIYNKRTIKIIIPILLVLLMTFFFKENLLNRGVIKNNINFDAFQKDSESLVINKIFSEKYNLYETKYGLLCNKNKQYIQDIEKQKADELKDTFTEYKSQVGIQGKCFSFLYNKLGMSIDMLYLLNSLLLSIVLVLICNLLSKKYGKLFASIFFLVFLLSPWITAFARNLYWIPFTWFLPAVIILLLQRNIDKYLYYLPFIFLSVLLKSLCGYEYLTTILLFSVSFLICDFFVSKDKKEKIKIAKIVITIGIISVFAFLTAIAIHGYMKGNGNVIEGIKSIYENDVLRRISIKGYDISKQAQTEAMKIQKSFNISTIEVIFRYLLFYTSIIKGISGIFFIPLILLSIYIVIMNICFIKRKDSNKDAILLLMLFLTTISWYILAKPHSYIHYHMNYVLWYFGFVQMMFYIIVKSIIEFAKKIKLPDNKIYKNKIM